jgi:hypothetical protein
MSWVFREAEHQALAAAKRGPRERRRELRLALSGRTNDVKLSTFACGIGVVALLAVGLASGIRTLDPSAFAGEAPESSSTALLTMWQVLGAAFGIAFPLLLLFAQFAREPVVLAKSAAQVLLRTSYADVTGVFLLVAVTVLGGCALWLQSDSTVVVCFLVLFVPGLSLLGFAYLRAIQLVLDPIRLRERSAEIIKRQLRASIARAWLYERAGQLLVEAFRLQDIDLQVFRGVPDFDAANWQVVLDGSDGFVVDIDADRVAGVLNALTPEQDLSAEASGVAPSAERPKAILGAWPGEHRSKGRALLSVRGFVMTEEQMSELRRLLVGSIDLDLDAVSL